MDNITVIGSGFAARAIAAAFAKEPDTHVRILVGHDTTEAVRSWLVRQSIEVFEGDHAESDEAIAACVTGASMVVHAGFHLPPVMSKRLTRAQYDHDHVAGTEAVLAVCRAKNVRRIAMISSHWVTLDGQVRSHGNEDMPPPESHLDDYSETLALAEDLVMSAVDMETLSFRPGWLWGPGDTEFLAYLLSNNARGIPLVGSGRALIPTTHIGHLVDVVVASRSAEFLTSAAYYVTDDERVSWRSFITRMLTTVGTKASFHNSSFAVARAKAWWNRRFDRPQRLGMAEICALGQTAFFNLKKVRTELGFRTRTSIGALMLAMGHWTRAAGGVDALLDDDRSLSAECDEFTVFQAAQVQQANDTAHSAEQ